MTKPKIFIACDTTNLMKAKKIINQSKTNKIKIGYKFGLEFMNSKNGRKHGKTTQKILKENKKRCLDHKPWITGVVPNALLQNTNKEALLRSAGYER